MFRVARMLGRHALINWGADRVLRVCGVQRRRLPDRAVPQGPFLAAGALPALPVVRTVAEHALDIDVFAGGDLRLQWEKARWTALPDLDAAAADACIMKFLAENPPYRGIHWISAQEAAIRLLHLARAAMRLDAARNPSPGLRALVALHLHRVRVSRRYEEAQDNNHGISCAAAAVAGALLLGRRAAAARAARRLCKLTQRLFAPCGAFSQHSVRYQRMAVDVLSIVQECAAYFSLPVDLHAVHRAAAGWLERLTDPVSQAGARIGHDDGTRLNAPALPARLARPRRWSGRGFMGFAARPGLWAVLRTPGGRHRPAHADLLHLDLWRDGVNLLRDSGSGVYNRAWWSRWFPSTRAHNTATFDGAEQMPRFGRFLIGPWPRGGVLPDGGWIADGHGNRHQRRVRLQGEECRVEDVLSGPYRRALLRWHLPAGPARLDGAVLHLEQARITVSGAADVWLGTAPDSPAYGLRWKTPVLCVAAPAGGACVVTRISARAAAA